MVVDYCIKFLATISKDLESKYAFRNLLSRFSMALWEMGNGKGVNALAVSKIYSWLCSGITPEVLRVAYTVLGFKPGSTAYKTSALTLELSL